MHPSTASSAPPVTSVMSPNPGQRLGMAKFMYAFDAVTAGAIGVGLLAAPEQVGQVLLSAPQDPVTARLAGAVFTGFAVVSVAGFRDPGRYLPLFLVQGCYKVLWLAATLPVLSSRPALTGMAASFVVYLTGYAIALRRAGWPAAIAGRNRHDAAGTEAVRR